MKDQTQGVLNKFQPRNIKGIKEGIIMEREDLLIHI